MQTPYEKIMDLDTLLEWREDLRAKGRRVVVTNGCFDILHQGHVEYLFKARSLGDAMIVALNSDASTRALKGPTRPVNGERSRAILLSCLYFVDAVYIFDSPRCTSLFKAVKPDLYVKGADYDLTTMNQEEKAALISVGSDISFIELTEGFSTTATIEKINS